MAEPGKAHGMAGDLVEPDWPPLTLVELRALFEYYPELGVPAAIRFVSPRPLSAAAVIDTAHGPVFVKRHARNVRDREGMHEEHWFMAHLSAGGAPVPQVFTSEGGETAIEIDDWTYEVHEAGKGVDMYADAISWTPFFCDAHAWEAGRALARLHLVAESFGAPRRKVQPLVAGFSIFATSDAEGAMREYLRARPVLAEHAEVKKCAENVLEFLAPYHRELLPHLAHLSPLWTQNDFHASNLLWNDSSDDARVTSIVDFGLADRTNAMHDLANAIERNIVGWLELVKNPEKPEDVPVHFTDLRALLAGYESVRPLTATEAAALAPMTAICHVEFALSEADYFLSALHSEENARRAYDEYLVGHARWFSSQRGASLLDALRRWAEESRPAKREDVRW